MSSLRNALLISASALRLSSEITVRVDNSSSFQGLLKDSILSSHGIRLVVGRVFNPNKNPIAERAVQELENQFLRHGFSGRQLTSVDLALSDAALNSKLRFHEMSATELHTCRDQYTGEPIFC